MGRACRLQCRSMSTPFARPRLPRRPCENSSSARRPLRGRPGGLALAGTRRGVPCPVPGRAPVVRGTMSVRTNHHIARGFAGPAGTPRRGPGSSRACPGRPAVHPRRRRCARSQSQSKHNPRLRRAGKGDRTCQDGRTCQGMQACSGIIVPPRDPTGRAGEAG